MGAASSAGPRAPARSTSTPRPRAHQQRNNSSTDKREQQTALQNRTEQRPRRKGICLMQQARPAIGAANAPAHGQPLCDVCVIIIFFFLLVCFSFSGWSGFLSRKDQRPPGCLQREVLPITARLRKRLSRARGPNGVYFPAHAPSVRPRAPGLCAISLLPLAVAALVSLFALYLQLFFSSVFFSFSFFFLLLQLTQPLFSPARPRQK